MDLEKLVLEILAQGTSGDAKHIYQWGKMLYEIFQNPLPKELFDVKNEFEKEKKIFSPYLTQNFFQNWKIDKVKEILENLEKTKKVQVIPPYGEYCLKDMRESFAQKNFFVSNNFDFFPLQYIRSKVSFFCEYHQVAMEEKEEIIIVVTEAAENALKYSNVSPIYIEQNLAHETYFLKMLNIVPDYDLNAEISKGKFSQDSSLMRGVLVMSRLMDEIDIKRNVEKNRVELFAKKKLKFL